MNKLSPELEEEYNSIIKNLIMNRYPDSVIKDLKYYIPSKHLAVQIHRSKFYLDIDTDIYHQVPIFRQKGIWSFPFLQFGIQLTASTGSTYSYPNLREIEINNQDDLLLLATYMFSCADTAISFFDYEYKKVKDYSFRSPMEGLYTYKSIGGGASVKPPSDVD